MGIGDKTAVQLLQRYGTVDGVLAAADAPDMIPRARKHLASRQAVDDARLSLELVTLCSDVDTSFPLLQRPLDAYARRSSGVNPKDPGRDTARRAVLKAVLEEYGFRSVISQGMELLLWG
jgi:5'-3' exonuclease